MIPVHRIYLLPSVPKSIISQRNRFPIFLIRHLIYIIRIILLNLIVILSNCDNDGWKIAITRHQIDITPIDKIASMKKPCVPCLSNESDFCKVITSTWRKSDFVQICDIHVDFTFLQVSQNAIFRREILSWYSNPTFAQYYLYYYLENYRDSLQLR